LTSAGNFFYHNGLFLYYIDNGITSLSLIFTLHFFFSLKNELFIQKRTCTVSWNSR